MTKIFSLFLSVILFLNFAYLNPVLASQKESKADVKEEIALPAQSNPHGRGSSFALEEITLESLLMPNLGRRGPSSVIESVTASAALRLKQEVKVKEAVRLWNQSPTYRQLIEDLSFLSKEDKVFLQSVLKSIKIEKTKPVRVEYIPQKNRLMVRFQDIFQTLWVLSMDPSLILYDGSKVMEYYSGMSVRGLFPDFQDIIKPTPSSKAKKTSHLFREFFLLSQAHAGEIETLSTLRFPTSTASEFVLIAQTTTSTADSSTQPTFYDPWKAHNDMIQKQQEYNKKIAKEQTKWSKIILAVFGLSIAGALILPPLYNKVAHAVNPHWGGADGYFKLREDIGKLRETYPEIDDTVLNVEMIKVVDFSCTGSRVFNRPGILEKIRYQYPNVDSEGQPLFDGRPFNEVKINLMNPPSVKGDIIKGKNIELSRKVQALEKCCQQVLCEKWMKERLKDTGGDGVEEFMDTKEKEVKGSGTK